VQFVAKMFRNSLQSVLNFYSKGKFKTLVISEIVY